MTFGEKLRRARKEKGLTQAELANQAGLGLRTIIAYEKSETYPQKRSTYQTLADILGVQPDDLRNEETSASGLPLSRVQWENARQQYEALLPAGPGWPGDPTYEAYCERMRQFAGLTRANDFSKNPDQDPKQITIRPALMKDFPTLLEICKARYRFDSTRKGVDTGAIPSFESRLESLTKSLIGWISAGQCFLMEENGRPGAWFVLQLPEADVYSAAGKRKSGAKASAAAPLPRATMLGPFTNRRYLWPSGYMLAFCQACCPRLEILVPLDDPQYQTYWMDRGFVPDSLAEEGNAIRLVLRGQVGG